MTESEIITALNRWTESLNNKDFNTFYEIEKESMGYGWRGSTFRDQPLDREKKKAAIMGFLDSMKKYICRFEPEKINVIDNTALVCGSYIEDVTKQDNSREHNNVRTSMTWMKRKGQWMMMLYHRDTQFT